ncbi:hypothetical protein DESC_490021 [Desulfosarcina cetonica]|nr:hypothetical protein DESC_490021 [Desulfosarcina cetonica]
MNFGCQLELSQILNFLKSGNISIYMQRPNRTLLRKIRDNPWRETLSAPCFLLPGPTSKRRSGNTGILPADGRSRPDHNNPSGP